jgi:deoxycytidylate deaminase
MSFNYYQDDLAQKCLLEAKKSKARIDFGAILVHRGRIIGSGHNRRSNKTERKLLTHVDYAIHAEQACVVNALKRGLKKGELEKLPCIIYVMGIINSGQHRGTLTVRRRKEFICRKCPPSILLRFNIPVCIPHVSGWLKLTPEEAM